MNVIVSNKFQALLGTLDIDLIKSINGREIIDSRGNPTVEVDVILESGAFGRA